MAGPAPDGKGVVLLDQMGSYDNCSICHYAMRYNKFLELNGCMHSFCKSCVMETALRLWKAGRTFTCPLCRSTDSNLSAVLNIACTEVGRGPLPPGSYRVYTLEDCYGNWHPYGVKDLVTEARFKAKCNPGMQTFTKCMTCHISPYSGWIVPGGAPRNSARFTDVRRFSPP